MGEHRGPRGREGTHPGRSSFVRNVETPTAPRCALLYPPLSGERLEVISLGLVAYLTSKEERGK